MNSLTSVVYSGKINVLVAEFSLTFTCKVTRVLADFKLLFLREIATPTGLTTVT